MRQFVRHEALAVRRARQKAVARKRDVATDGKGLRTQRCRACGCGWVCVDTDCPEVAAEALLHEVASAGLELLAS